MFKGKQAPRVDAVMREEGVEDILYVWSHYKPDSAAKQWLQDNFVLQDDQKFFGARVQRWRRTSAQEAPDALEATTAETAPAASGMSRWLGPIAGIAAGLGLAALAGLGMAFARPRRNARLLSLLLLSPLLSHPPLIGLMTPTLASPKIPHPENTA